MESNHLSPGPADWFTGTMRLDPLFPAHEPARAAGASVTFEPGARTAWHTHPVGQTLVVTAGVSRVQVWGGSLNLARASGAGGARRGRRGGSSEAHGC
jgi:quercetin dioxygenase-like cupin family protein